MPEPFFLGLDFGTESVRAVCVDRTGSTIASAVSPYARGQITAGSAAARELFPAPLPPSFALQDPADWIESAAQACRLLPRDAAARVAGVGVDFTSCTMLPALSDGTPLCAGRRDLSADPHTWPKLWKHHGALTQTDRINRIAQQRREPWLARYGGIVGLEWLFPKILEVIESSPAAANAAEVWLEAGDWFVWQLVGSPCAGGRTDAVSMPRSTCQAGYKGLWSSNDGFPSAEYLTAVNPAMAVVRAKKLPGRFVAPGQQAGLLCESLASKMGLRPGIAVSAAIIDAHSGVPGAGVGEPGTLVMVMGTSGCHMLMSDRESLIPGVAGIVRDGILPGYVGYETGQAAMGDGFDAIRRLTGKSEFGPLTAAANLIPPGAGGVLALDWFNGCRTPLMDGSLKGALLGLTLQTTPEQVYRAALEGSAFGLRWIVDTLREGGVPVERFVATGGLPSRNPLFASITASVLGRPVVIHGAEHGPALGAAILGALAAGRAAGGYDNVKEAVSAMAGAKSRVPPARTVEPERNAAAAYERLYPVYRQLADEMAAPGSPLRRLEGPRGC